MAVNYMLMTLPVEVTCLLAPADELIQEPVDLPAEVMAELQAEALVMAQMRHENIVSFMGLCPSPPCILTGIAPGFLQLALSGLDISHLRRAPCRVLRPGIFVRRVTSCRQRPDRGGDADLEAAHQNGKNKCTAIKKHSRSCTVTFIHHNASGPGCCPGLALPSQ